MNEKIRLSKKQEQCVNFRPEGDLLIRGIPGSGKSTIIMARAQYLRKNFPNESVLILTFNRALTDYVRQLSLKTGNEPVEAKTFHHWGKTLLKETDYPHTKLILGDKRKDAIKFALNTIKKRDPNIKLPKMKGNKQFFALVDFLADEIEWIKGSEINTKEEYLNIKRSGRGTQVRVTKQHREAIYDVLEKYNELLHNHRNFQGIDGEDLASIIINHKDQIPIDKRPDHILIDEAQDLHTLQLKAVSSIAKKSLTIGADKGQQIYRRTFTWKKSGIDVVGNRSRFLDETFRSTRQIVRLANHFQEQDELFTKDEEYMKAKEPDIDGKVPELYLCKNHISEKKHILEHIKKIRGSFPEDTIGVIANKKLELEKLKTKIEKDGIPVVIINQDKADMVSPGVKLSTFHSSKGLEFDHVIVTGLKEGKLPYKFPAPGEDEEEFLSRERKKLYVAMTRAKKTLVILAVKPYSKFIYDLDNSLYKIVRDD